MKLKKRLTSNPVFDYTVILAGNLAYAFGIAAFVRPANVPPGGVGGIAQMINFLTGLPMGVMVIVLNIPLFLISFKSMGRKFLARSAVATVASSLLIDFLAPYESRFHITDDRFLQTLYGGVLIGLGLGLVFLRGGTTGGSDIIAKLLTKKWPHISLGRINLGINGVVIAAAVLVYGNIEAALYAVVIQFVVGSVIDMLISGADHASAALVVTDKPREVSEAVLSEMQRGCTGLESKGMYTQAERMTLLVAVRPHEASGLKALVVRTDPQAFVIFLNAREVVGRGFGQLSRPT